MDAAIARIAADQHTVFSWAQARAAGFTAAKIAHRLERGRWIAVTDRVLRMAGAPETPRSVVMATVLSAGRGAATTGTTALALAEIRDFELLPAHVVVGRRPHRLALPGVVETFYLPDHHVIAVDGIPTVTVARAIFDLAGTIGPRRLARAVDAALAARRVTVPELDAMVRDVSERGRSGAPRLRAVLEERMTGYSAPSSVLESRFLELVHDAGLPVPAQQVTLSGRLGWIGTVDFAWPERRLVVETDGGAFHDSITDREEDERRDRALEREGWTVLRFNWNDVTKRPTSVVRTVKRALAVAA